MSTTGRNCRGCRFSRWRTRTEDRDLTIRRTRARFDKEAPSTPYDVKIVTKNGNVKWVELCAQNLELHGKSVILGTAVDITARKKSEAALNCSEERFRAFTENSPVMIYTYDSRGYFTYANKLCEKATGYARENLLKMHFSALLDDADKEIGRQQAVARFATSEQIPSWDCLICRKDGTRRRWELSGIRLEDDHGEPMILGNAIDITDRFAAEQALKKTKLSLRDEQEQLLTTLRSIGDAVVTTDLEGRVVLLNRVAEKLTGWSQNEARGRRIGEVLELVRGHSAENAAHPLAQAIQGVVLEPEEDTILRSRRGQPL
ncbi:MAG TPA: PAS domain S-box protein [Proteobacteria bacterium]|nr:PAS domain S-box protein [Pseudomonadota bacterium]